HRQKQKKLIMLPSETMIWQPEFTDKTLSRKPGAVQIDIPESGDKTYSMTDRRQCGYLCWRLADRPKHWPDTRKANW
ncbi:TPA: hypothetical protein ACIXY9_004918, partial [Escherichia coli]